MGGRERRRARKSGFVSIIQMLLFWPIWAQLPLSAGGTAPTQVQSEAPGSVLLWRGGGGLQSFSASSILATECQSRDLRAPEASKLGQIHSFISQLRKRSQETGSDGPRHSSTDIVMVCAIYPQGRKQPLNTFIHLPACLKAT